YLMVRYYVIVPVWDDWELAMNQVRSISSAPEPVLRDCPESPSLSVEITDFADTDSTIVCEGIATWDGSEVNSNDLFLVLSNQNVRYRIPTKEKINRFEPNGGFFVLILKSSLPGGNTNLRLFMITVPPALSSLLERTSLYSEGSLSGYAPSRLPC
ncbi:MAG: hypothetical protein WEB33_08015, partial [Bacteroidota bacterium]